MYGDIYDGLRSFYSRREGERSSPGFSAAMLLSFMCGLNLVALTVLSDLAINRRPLLMKWIWAHEMLLLATGVAIAWAHVTLGKWVGIYHQQGPARFSGWVRQFVFYAMTTAVALVASLVAVYMNHRNA